ncbi:MAG: chemotaxis protein CheW [Firmicutes bacterium HGW-Firmicutes-12]|jgi:purine-binding chemotaxis protein CheW|nr:MAG: chemotaxis protein CheW [Firmicutes bacterium HGW-Firmicutes-12]
MSEEQVVVFKLGQEEYALPISEVREIINYSGLTKIPNAPLYMEGIINLRGSIVPVINLASRFDRPFTLGVEPKVIIIETGEHNIGVIVNEVTEVLRLNEENIEPVPVITKNNATIRGIGKMNDRLLILLSLKRLFSDQELQKFEEAS